VAQWPRAPTDCTCATWATRQRHRSASSTRLRAARPPVTRPLCPPLTHLSRLPSRPQHSPGPVLVLPAPQAASFSPPLQPPLKRPDRQTDSKTHAPRPPPALRLAASPNLASRSPSRSARKGQPEAGQSGSHSDPSARLGASPCLCVCLAPFGRAPPPLLDPFGFPRRPEVAPRRPALGVVWVAEQQERQWSALLGRVCCWEECLWRANAKCLAIYPKS